MYIPIIPGEVFGRLVVVSKANYTKWKKTIYTCKCSCGNILDVPQNRLRGNKTRSCGCFAKEQSSIRNSLPPGEASWNEWYNNYKKSAIFRDKDFLLPFEDFKILCTHNCYWCGEIPHKWNKYTTLKGVNTRTRIPTQNKIDQSWIEVNGIDRLNSSLGYTTTNSVPCCSTCNYMKRCLGEKEFFAHITKIYKHRNKTP